MVSKVKIYRSNLVVIALFATMIVIGSLIFREPRHGKIEPKVGENFVADEPPLALSFVPAVAVPILNKRASSVALQLLKPLLIEVGALVILQTVGVPVIASLSSLLRRLRFLPVHHFSSISAKTLQTALRRGSKIWYNFGKFYKKTSLSKVVNRSKKIIKTFQHKDEEKHH